MENKKNSLFRQKSIESIASPEVLDQYLRVTSPGLWVVFGAVLAFLAGAFIWSIFGTLQTTVSAAVVINDEYQCALIPEGALQTVINERSISVDGKEIDLAPKSIAPVIAAEDWDVYVMLAGGLKPGDIVYPIQVESPLDEGIYTGTVVTEKIHPISFLLN